MFRKIASLILIAVLCTGLLSGCFWYGYSSSGNYSNGPSFSGAGSTQLVNEFSLDLTNVNDLYVDYISEDIYISFKDVSQLTIREYMNINDPQLYANTKWQGNSLIIECGKRNNLLNFSSYIEVDIPTSYAGMLSFDNTSGKITTSGKATLASFYASSISGRIEVANITADYLYVDSTSGALTVSDIEVTELSAYSISGRIDLKNCKTTTMTASSTSGSITCGSCTGEFTLESLSGVIVATAHSGAGEAETTSSRIDIDLLEYSGNDIDIESTSGSVTLKLPRGSEFYFSGSSISGKITTGFDNLNLSAHGNVNGVVGSNPKAEISIETTSGRIEASYR